MGLRKLTSITKKKNIATKKQWNKKKIIVNLITKSQI